MVHQYLIIPSYPSHGEDLGPLKYDSRLFDCFYQYFSKHIEHGLMFTEANISVSLDFSSFETHTADLYYDDFIF